MASEPMTDTAVDHHCRIGKVFYKVPSDPVKALANAGAGRRVDHGMPVGRSFAGGFTATLGALRRKGLLDGCNITLAGRALLSRKDNANG